MNEHFSLARLGYLLKGDFIGRYRSLLIVAGTLTLLMLGHGMLLAAFNENPSNPFDAWAFGMFLVWGPIAASRSFVELHDKTQNEGFLLLPASALEKVVSRLLLMTLGLAVFVLLLTNVVSLVNAALAAVIFGRTDMFYAPVGLGPGEFGFYMAQQSMFFAGAAWFRKNHFIKTSLALSIGAVGFAFFVGFVIRVLFPELADPFDSGLFQLNFEAFFDANEATFASLLRWFALLNFVGIPIVCWVLAWMRVKETQVSHGV
jgi:hypothetical protein